MAGSRPVVPGTPVKRRDQPTHPTMETNRRIFLKKSALVAGAASFATPSFVHAAGNDTLKVALVGCGGRGTADAKQALSNPGVKIVALADAFMGQCEHAEKELQGANKGQGSSVEVGSNKFAGLDAYKKAIDLCDVLVTAAPPGFRPFHFEYAVKQGKHVFMQKPVATSAVGIQKVLAAAAEAKKKNLKVVVGFQRQNSPDYIETRKRIQDGLIGEVLSMHVYWNGDGIWNRARQNGQTELQYQANNWYHLYHMSGDGIVEQHIHNIDIALWMSGLKVDRAYGSGGREVRRDPKIGNIWDHFAVEFGLNNGGMMNSWWRHIPKAQGRVGEQLIGTKANASGGRIFTRDGKELWKYEGPKPDPQQVEKNVLFSAIRENTDVNMAEAAAYSTMVAILGRMAAYSGDNIPMSRAMNAKDQIVPDTADWNAPIGVKPGANGEYDPIVPGQYDAFNPPGAIAG